jgi:YbgC/YbaW family acyl-CoA thioester hydrolase
MSTIHTYEITILEKHLDSFGHMNNATYLELLEEARWDLITSRGYGYEKIHSLNLGPVILEVNLKFRREIKGREKITIQTKLLNYRDRIGVLQQEMINSEKQTCAVAEFKFGLFDLKNRKLVRPTADWLNAIGHDPKLHI